MDDNFFWGCTGEDPNELFFSKDNLKQQKLGLEVGLGRDRFLFNG